MSTLIPADEALAILRAAGVNAAKSPARGRCRTLCYLVGGQYVNLGRLRQLAREAQAAQAEAAPVMAEPEAQAVAHLCRAFPISTPATWAPAVARLQARGVAVTVGAILRETERPGPVTLPGEDREAVAARRLAESVGRVCDAVCDAADGWDAEPVVAIEPGNACHAATLQQSGVSYVRRLATVTGGFVASHNGRATAAFDSIADAVAHAAGPVAPVILPGENADAVAAVLAIRADAAAGHRVSLADLARAQSAAIRADGDAAHARGIARAAGMRAAIDAELARD